MKFKKTKIEGVYIIQLEPRGDARGYFSRVFGKDELPKDVSFDIVQINRSKTKEKGTIRGIHYQLHPKEEDKIIQCLSGSIFDVAVDLRKNSKTYGKWVGVKLTDKNMNLLVVPKGVAHAFQTLEANTVVEYFVSQYYSPEYEKGIRWNDPSFKIDWPIKKAKLSNKDASWADFTKPLKIMLIAGNGQVGSEVEKIARVLGHDIKSYDHKNLDVTDYSAVRSAIERFSPNVVINASGYHVVLDCEEKPERAFEINAFALKNLAEICAEKDIYLVNFSSDKVFDGTSRVPYKENDRPNPIQMYGVSKLAGELEVGLVGTKNITIRTCGVFGGLYGSTMKKGNFVLYILREAKSKKELEISSDQIASFVNAEDLARVVIEMIERKIEGGIYHVVNTGYGSWASFAKEIVKIADLPLKIIPVDRSGTYTDYKIPEFAALDNSKIKKLGIEISDWQSSLKRYIQFLKENNAL